MFQMWAPTFPASLLARGTDGNRQRGLGMNWALLLGR